MLTCVGFLQTARRYHQHAPTTMAAMWTNTMTAGLAPLAARSRSRRARVPVLSAAAVCRCGAISPPIARKTERELCAEAPRRERVTEHAVGSVVTELPEVALAFDFTAPPPALEGTIALRVGVLDALAVAHAHESTQREVESE
jgi:hypothetical protein